MSRPGRSVEDVGTVVETSFWAALEKPPAPSFKKVTRYRVVGAVLTVFSGGGGGATMYSAMISAAFALPVIPAVNAKLKKPVSRFCVVDALGKVSTAV